jgi:rubrerythrin
MAFDQTKDVLDHARKFHQKLSVFYDDLKSSTQKERARALLDYMSSHEQYLDERLKKFEEEVSDNVLDTYFKYGSESTKICEISDFEIKPVMGVDDVIAAAMHFDACLIKFYSEMAQRSLSNKVREVFENLLVMEQHEQIELSKTSLELGAL